MFRKKIQEYITKGEYLILYFYPKDNTPGCSLEARDFSTLQKVFSSLGVRILGVSKDSKSSHKNFIEKQSLTIPLLSDESLEIHNEFNIIGEKKNYGRTYMGVIRSTFLLDANGNNIKEWRNVRAKGHAERVLKWVREYIKVSKS